jgi:cobalt-zinc-cadmium efflux system outer membrane protein
MAARARLAATWGGAANEVPAVHGTLQLPDTLPSERALLDKLAGHPRIAHQQAIIAARRAALDLERAQAAQDITIGGGVRFLREGSDAALVAGVSVPLPVRNRNQGSIRAAREILAGAEQTVRAVEAGLRTEFVAAWQEAGAAHAAAQHLRRDALPATEEAHAVVRRAYDEGQLPFIDVLDAQRELVALRRELLELEVKFAAAHARAEALADPQLPATSTLFSLP